MKVKTILLVTSVAFVVVIWSHVVTRWGLVTTWATWIQSGLT